MLSDVDFIYYPFSLAVIPSVVDDCMDAGGRVTQERLPRDLFSGCSSVVEQKIFRLRSG